MCGRVDRRLSLVALDRLQELIVKARFAAGAGVVGQAKELLGLVDGLCLDALTTPVAGTWSWVCCASLSAGAGLRTAAACVVVWPVQRRRRCLPPHCFPFAPCDIVLRVHVLRVVLCGGCDSYRDCWGGGEELWWCWLCCRKCNAVQHCGIDVSRGACAIGV